MQFSFEYCLDLEEYSEYSIQIGAVLQMDQIAQWATELSRLMIPDTLTRCRTGWIRMQRGGRTFEHLKM